MGFTCGRVARKQSPSSAPILSTLRRLEGEWRGIAHILSIFEERDKSLRALHVRTENKQEAFLAPPALPSLHRSVRPTGALWKTKLGLLEEDDSSS